MIYPASHKKLAETILASSGALISEFPCTAIIQSPAISCAETGLLQAYAMLLLSQNQLKKGELCQQPI